MSLDGVAEVKCVVGRSDETILYVGVNFGQLWVGKCKVSRRNGCCGAGDNLEDARSCISFFRECVLLRVGWVETSKDW